MKNSGFGLASFVMSVLVGVLVFLIFAIAAVMRASSPNGIDQQSAAAITLGLSLLGLLFVDAIALGLGVAGLLQRDRVKTSAILGVVISAAIGAGTVALVALALMMHG